MNEVMPVDEELDNPCPRIPKITKVEEKHRGRKFQTVPKPDTECQV